MEYTKRQIERIKRRAEEQVAEFMKLHELPPDVLHLRINKNQIFRDQYVVNDVLNENRYLDV